MMAMARTQATNRLALDMPLMAKASATDRGRFWSIESMASLSSPNVTFISTATPDWTIAHIRCCPSRSWPLVAQLAREVRAHGVAVLEVQPSNSNRNCVHDFSVVKFKAAPRVPPQPDLRRGAGSLGTAEQGDLPRARSGQRKPLRLGGEALNGDGGVLRIALDADEAAPETDSGDASRAGATEGVENQLVGVGEEFDEFEHQWRGLLRLVARSLGEVVLVVNKNSVSATAVPATAAFGVREDDRLVAHARAVAAELRHAVGLHPDADALGDSSAIQECRGPFDSRFDLAKRDRPTRREPSHLRR